MNAIELISQDVFDKIRSRFSNLEMGDEGGAITQDPRKARFFDFDFVIEGNALGRVSISINEIGTLKIFYSQDLLENSDPISQDLWYDFLREMRNFSKRRLLRFDTRDITKRNLDKKDFEYLATTGSKDDTMSESRLFGSRKSSYRVFNNENLKPTKIVIRHSEAIDPEQRGSRSRKINSVFIENYLGERWKCPYNNLPYAEAMAMHVAHEGMPYDEAGKAITKMCEQVLQLREFQKHVGLRDSMNMSDHVDEILNKSKMKLESLKTQLHKLGKATHYKAWKESFMPSADDEQMVLDQATMEDYKNKFTINTFKEDLAQFFPLIHSIMQETSDFDLEDYVKEGEGSSTVHCSQCEGEFRSDKKTGFSRCEEHKGMKNYDLDETTNEFNQFESWADSVVEGRLGPDALYSLKELLDNGLKFGVDGSNAIESLEGIGIHDDALFKEIEEAAQNNAESDANDIVLNWLNEFDPEAAKEFGYEEQPQEPEMSQELPQGAETEESQQEDMDKECSTKDIAEMVKSFYDRETGKFPLGKTGVLLKVKKEKGDRAASLAERLIDHLESKDQFSMEGTESEQGVAEGSVDSKYPHGEVKYRIVYRKSGERVEGVKSFNSKADAQQYASKDPQYSVQAYRVKQGVAEGSERKDMTGQTCEKCKKDKYKERSQHDDMEGKVTCSCGHRVNRWKNYKEQGVAEAKSPGEFIKGIRKMAGSKTSFQVGDWVEIDPNKTAGWASSGLIGRIDKIYINDDGEETATVNVNPELGALGRQTMMKLKGGMLGPTGSTLDLGRGIRMGGTHTSVPTSMIMKVDMTEDQHGVAEGSTDSNTQDAIVNTVERLFRKNEINDYGALEAIRQGVKHHFTKPGATAESAIEGILNILDKRMRKSDNYLDLRRFKEALRQGVAHQLKKQGVAEGSNELLRISKLAGLKK